MIKSFKHKGLEKVQNILLTIDSAFVISDLALPSYKLHPLKGNMKDLWSITVRANWRITFKFEQGNAYILNYEDYH